jgi:Cache 3/Cache 2 fusion domain
VQFCACDGRIIDRFRPSQRAVLGECPGQQLRRGKAKVNGTVIADIRNNKAFYGEANILGKAYITGYEPIHDSSNNVIGIYYVGYLK